MAIKYVSKHHSQNDPGGLIREALNMGEEFPGPAEDLVLAWMLALGNERDPAEAAKELATAYGFAEGPVPPDETGRIVEMLRQTAAFPKDRLSGQPRDRRRGAGQRRAQGSGERGSGERGSDESGKDSG